MGPVRIWEGQRTGKRYVAGSGKTVRVRHRGGTGWKRSVRETRGQKNNRGRYGQNGTGLSRGHVRARCGVGDVPVQAPHVCRYAARTGNIRGPLGCPSSLLWAVLGLSLPCPYPARTGPVRACLLGIQIDASKD